MPYISSGTGKDSVQLYYEDWGSGKPIVFIHGWPSSHEMWEYQLTYFGAKGFRCIAYDRRGFGKSSKPWESYDYNTLASDLKLLMDQLDLQDVTLVGFSMGGGEVARYCSLYNQARVSKVVLVGTVLPMLQKSPSNPEGLDQEIFDGIIMKIIDDRPAFLADFGKQFFGETFIKHPVSQAYLDWAFQLTLQGSPKATIDCVTSWSSTDFRDDIRKITVPTLIIHGTNDKTVPIEISSDRTAAMLPAAKYLKYDGAPHGLFYTDRDQLNSDIEEFLRG